MWYYLLQSKLDPDTQKDWAMEKKGKEVLTYDSLIHFLNAKIKAMESNSFSDSKSQKPLAKEPKQLFPASKVEKDKEGCPVSNCTAKHDPWACDKFRSKEPKERKEIIKQANRCFNCLRAGHSVAMCPSESSCKTCHKRHHSMLHENRSQVAAQLSCCVSRGGTISILPTAVVRVKDVNGRQVKFRAMVDTGAQINAITEHACARLRIKPHMTDEQITGVNQTDSQPASGEVKINIQTNEKRMNIACLVLPSIATGDHPRQKIDQETVEQLQQYNLADKKFWAPGPIDLLLGVEVIAGIIRGRNVKIGQICLMETTLGWTVAGKANSFDSDCAPLPKSISLCQSERQRFERFWEVEDLPTTREAKLSREELECIKHYDETTLIQDSGRPLVRLPFKRDKSIVCPDTGDLLPDIGHSSKKALSQFLRNEQKLCQSESARKQYVNFFHEMMDMKHIEEVPAGEENLSPEKHFVMPHHAVWKEDLTTTKCRAVFNGSAPTTNGVSLNDCLLVGPNQQPDLFQTIIKFRFYPIARSGDASKMYRQVALNPKDRNYHQFYWRSSRDDPIKKWRFTVVIYGVTSASYHAIRALRSGAGYAKTDQGGSEILHSFYVDDMCGGGDDEKTVIKIYEDVSAALKSIGMEVRKWASNSAEVMKMIPEELHESQDLFLSEITHSIKSLGMRWRPKTDVFHYKSISHDQQMTIIGTETPSANHMPEKSSKKSFFGNDVIFDRAEVPEGVTGGTSFIYQSRAHRCPMILGKNRQDPCTSSAGRDFSRPTAPQVLNAATWGIYRFDQHQCPVHWTEDEEDPTQVQKIENPSCEMYQAISPELQVGDESSIHQSSQHQCPVPYAEYQLCRCISSCPCNFCQVTAPSQEVTPTSLIAHSDRLDCPMNSGNHLEQSTSTRSLNQPKPVEQVCLAEDVTQIVTEVPDDLKQESILKNTTRRYISSNMGKVFDPIGLLTPVTLQPKILFQETWDGNIDWDDPVGAQTAISFEQGMESLHHLSKLQVPRFITCFSLKTAELHVFCDASSHAYGAAVYVRTVREKAYVSLLTAKSRLAPRKTISIPRLELCSMVLGVKLMKMVVEAVIPISVQLDCYGWSDSTISLSWIKSEPNRFGTFVSNRITKVQRLLPEDRWRHVPTHLNPADHTTRPVEPSKLADLSIWWTGPEFLKSDPINPPEQPDLLKTENLQELAKKSTREINLVSYRDTAGRAPAIDIKKYGNLSRAINVMYNVLKFTRIILKKHFIYGELRKHAMTLNFKHDQKENFKEELNSLKKGESVKRSSKISQLYHFLDEDGLLKVGGRLAAADCLNDDAKYQIILPAQSHLSRLIVLDAHRRLFHCGVNATVTETRQQFWILRVKTLAKSIVANCLACFRYNCRLEAQLMGDLPSERVNPSPPFSHVGIDFSGPITIFQGKQMKKCYAVVFVCFATKAVHLDVALSLKISEFESVLKRFIARRGCPEKIYSDNATNFIGARNDLLELRKALISENEKHAAIPQKVIDLGINWGTIPPRAPNFGGLWEAAVKSMKLLLRKTIGQARLTQSELYTALCQTEAILNSRPLTALQEESGDNSPITPNMLITGFRKTQIPVINKPQTNFAIANPNDRYSYVKKLVEEFWRRWREEYLASLQTRVKSQKEIGNFKVGDVVLVAEDNTPPFIWPLGKIIEVYTGNDDLVRVCKVKLNGKTLIRPIIKLRRLPFECA